MPRGKLAKNRMGISFLAEISKAWIRFEGELATVLHKKVDLIKIDSIFKNPDFISEIISTGVKIFR
jgi:hypothetical protein